MRSGEKIRKWGVGGFTRGQWAGRWQLGPSEGQHINGKVVKFTERSRGQGLVPQESEGQIGGVTQNNTVISDHKNDQVAGSMSGALRLEGTEHKTATRCIGGDSKFLTRKHEVQV